MTYQKHLYNYRSNIWVGPTPPQILKENEIDPFYTVFWYKIESKEEAEERINNPNNKEPWNKALLNSVINTSERKLMINLFVEQSDGTTKREWIDAAILSIATINRLGGFYNIKGDEWLNHQKYIKDVTGEYIDYGENVNSINYFQNQGNVGVNEKNGKLRAVSIDNGTFIIK